MTLSMPTGACLGCCQAEPCNSCEQVHTACSLLHSKRICTQSPPSWRHLGSSSCLCLCTLMVLTQSKHLQASGGRAAPSHSLEAPLQQPLQLPVLRNQQAQTHSHWPTQLQRGRRPAKLSSQGQLRRGRVWPRWQKRVLEQGVCPVLKQQVLPRQQGPGPAARVPAPRRARCSPGLQVCLPLSTFLPQQLPASTGCRPHCRGHTMATAVSVKAEHVILPGFQ